MKTAMILAAGRGERLKPLTQICPKALCIVRNKPIIEHHIINLAHSGFEKLIINHAYLGGKIKHYLGNGKKWNINIQYSPEPPGGLETGGGILNALPLIGKDTFLVVNADIYTDINFSSLKLDDNYLAHYVLIPPKTENLAIADFGINQQRDLSNNDRKFVFSGISVLNPKLFSGLKPSRFSIIPLIRQLADQNKVSSEIYKGIWHDIGTIKRLDTINS